VSWRQLAPVRSPVSPLSLPAGIAAACGLHFSDHQELMDTLRRRYGAVDVLLTDSGTSALILALQALVPRGGIVAYPAYGCIDLTTAALGAGVTVRLYDVDPMTLSPNLDSVRDAIKRGVDAVVVAHLFGYPADVIGVQRIAAEHGIPVIEDAAQGAGGSLAGKSLGSLADVSILSFGRGKGMTSGSGGALLVRTPPLAVWTDGVRCRLGAAPNGGREVFALAAQWLLSHPMLYRIPASMPALRLGEMVYHPPREPGPMAATAAALLPTALVMDDREIAGRRARAGILLSRLNGIGRMAPVRSIPEGESGYLRLALLDAVGDASPIPALGALRGYPATLEQHPQLRPILAPLERAGKGAIQLRDRLFTLPTHSGVQRGDVSRIARWMVS
jgi:perosamine synthetase